MPTPLWIKRLALPIADKLVYASSAYVDLKSAQISMANLLINFSGEPAGPGDQRLHEFARRIRPWTSDHLSLVRVGGDSDGGYVMAEDFGVDAAISIGVGKDVSWDQEIAQRGIPVVMFDPTIRRAPMRIAGARFVRVGLGPKQGSGAYKSLPELLQLASLPSANEFLLKVDVEGDEWGAFAEIAPHELNRFRQIVVELHGLKALRSEREAAIVLQALTALCENHIPIHIHANNYDELVRFNSNWFPNAIEVTLIRRDRLPEARLASTIRTDLDRPCDPRVSEISLAALTDMYGFD